MRDSRSVAASGRVALVHDFLLDLRGAERVFAALCDMYPEADLFTSIYDERGTEGRFAGRTIRTTFLQRLRPTARTFRPLLPLYPYAMESLDLTDYDLVISSSSGWAHGVIAPETALHVCYCHNPFRYAWNERERTLARFDPVRRAALGMVLQRWRTWDTIVAQRVDAYIANSEITRRRVRRYLARDAAVLHPPVETSRFAPSDQVGNEYVLLSELMPHKRIDVAIEAFNRLRLPLLVIGNGPEARHLSRIAGPTVRLAGRLSDDEVARLLPHARAMVVTANEEFGIAAVESLAAGRPVIALNQGGVQESVEDGVTGTFYESCDADALAAAVSSFDAMAVSPAECVAAAERFDVGHFQRGMDALVAQALDERERDGGAPRPRARRTRGLALSQT